jgi:hypothetical protein
MTMRPLVLPSLALVGLLMAVACTPDEAAAPTSMALAGAAEAPVCAADETVLGDLSDWPLAGVADAEILPVVMSSLVTVGPNRFLYNVLDLAYRQMAAPDIDSHIDFYALERDSETPAASVDASYLSSGLGRGLYRAAVEFDCVGEWGAEISVRLADGSTIDERLRFSVHDQGGTPGIGDPAPRSASLTAPTEDGARFVSTDLHPYLAAYDKTVAETVTSGRPSFVFFATPAFCQTGFCGPTVELVKGVAIEHEGQVEFVNVEPYELHMTDNGLQPVLDASGHVQPVQAALDYAIPMEPYLFLVDAEGDVFSRFEGVIGGDELRAAVEDVLAGDASLG